MSEDAFHQRRQRFDAWLEGTGRERLKRDLGSASLTCPCCGYPTLPERAGWQICPLCFWEDDGQDDPHAAECCGGPNEDYSLATARANFEQHLIMFWPGHRLFPQREAVLAAKRALMEEWQSAATTEADDAVLARLRIAIEALNARRREA
jgi:hypothetical protein